MSGFFISFAIANEKQSRKLFRITICSYIYNDYSLYINALLYEKLVAGGLAIAPTGILA